MVCLLHIVTYILIGTFGFRRHIHSPSFLWLILYHITKEKTGLKPVNSRNKSHLLQIVHVVFHKVFG